jgi:hypothetical protein
VLPLKVLFGILKLKILSKMYSLLEQRGCTWVYDLHKGREIIFLGQHVQNFINQSFGVMGVYFFAI